MWNKFRKIHLITRLYKSAGSSVSRRLYYEACDYDNIDVDAIEKNVLLRGHTNNNVHHIRLLLQQLKQNTLGQNILQIQKKLEAELANLPNSTHERLLSYGKEPHELLRFTPETSSIQESQGSFREFSEICKKLNWLRMDHLGNYTGHKSYYLMGPLAMLEQALIDYTVNRLQKYNFKLISVPDILPAAVIEGCGMQTQTERTQVYKLDSGMCLSGTAEMALAGYFANKIIPEKELPIKVCAVSRCFRAETSGLQDEKGIYRVHQFTKVEMFALCSAAEGASEELLESFKDIEMRHFRELELNFRLLDMPPFELGAPAYQKYDIETWMPGRKMWGEISSCSNCTDYQAKRLNIRYRSAKDNQLKYVHTINGTAAAIPRLLISIVESNQLNNGNSVNVPTVLRDFMKTSELKKDKRIPDIKLVKYLKLKQ